MNIRNLAITGLFFLGALFTSCSSSGEGPSNKLLEAEKSVEVSDLNPNGDSELAMLMRQLYEGADSVKSLIKQGTGNVSEDYINSIEECWTATPTDADVKDDQFFAMNDLLMHEAQVLLSSEGNHVKEFNSMVGRCIDCHNTVCPGPIDRIKKLYIK